MGDEGVNGDNMRSVGDLINEEYIADDLDDIGIGTESVPLTQNHVDLVPTTSTPTVTPTTDPTTVHATGTPSTTPATGGHTFTYTRRNTPTTKRLRTRPTTHVLDIGTNVMTTELSRITSELVARKEFD
ncbi:hypothetical protein GIB67_034428 [Kingdonia uniflora]|uniref:Uncharacterized protein n=1 Tax=Kingdonia uniflora TaxID=39325 RepID=A0A7J7PAW6_9MAGN|nr:hypothetical protein GIB67_034428 [Kingdonia uniflora]